MYHFKVCVSCVTVNIFSDFLKLSNFPVLAFQSLKLNMVPETFKSHWLGLVRLG